MIDNTACWVPRARGHDGSAVDHFVLCHVHWLECADQDQVCLVLEVDHWPQEIQEAP